MKAEITIEGESGMRAVWEQDDAEWMTATTDDLAASLARFAEDRDGIFDVVVILRPRTPNAT